MNRDFSPLVLTRNKMPASFKSTIFYTVIGKEIDTFGISVKKWGEMLLLFLWSEVLALEFWEELIKKEASEEKLGNKKRFSCHLKDHLVMLSVIILREGLSWHRFFNADIIPEIRSYNTQWFKYILMATKLHLAIFLE